MLIGGGENDVYVVTATFDNNSFYNLIIKSQIGEPIQLVAGGQQGEYPHKMCVENNSMFLAVKSFVLTGKLDSSFTWEHEGG